MGGSCELEPNVCIADVDCSNNGLHHIEPLTHVTWELDSPGLQFAEFNETPQVTLLLAIFNDRFCWWFFLHKLFFFNHSIFSTG